MHGRTDGRTDGRTNGRTDGGTEGRIDRRMEGFILPGNIFLLTAQSWTQQLGTANISVGPLKTFEQSYFKIESLRELLKSGVRIVVTLANSADTTKVALEAQSLDMTTPGWAWISTDFLPSAEYQRRRHR